MLDFGRDIAGPHCAALLGDLGADVTRIERLGGGEDRGVAPVTEDGDGDGDGGTYLQCNRKECGITLSADTPAGREVARRLVTGTEDQPYRANVNGVDFITAANCAIATLAALMAQASTGRRQTAGPVDLFRTRDGWIVLQVVGDGIFGRWCELVGASGWKTDPRFVDELARGAQGELRSARTQQWCAVLTTDAALGARGLARIPAGPVLTPQQALDHEQVRATGDLHPVAHPDSPVPAPVAAPTFELGATPAAFRRRPPQLGEHTEAVLRESGDRDAEIAALRAEGTV